VIRFLTGTLRNRPWRAGTLAVGLLAAAVSFVLLTGSAATSAIHVRSTLKRNFRGAYDILVRPASSFTPIERERLLVRDNYLSGIYGGITFRQYHTIEHLPGVSVAAPIANVGTVLAEEPVLVSLKRFVGSQQDQLFRVRFSWIAQAGLSRYPATDDYLYVTKRRFELGPQTVAVRDPVTGEPDLPCDGYNASAPLVYAPFAAVNSSVLFCASRDDSPALAHSRIYFGRYHPSVIFTLELPLNVAAIDPAAEAKLVGLSRALVSGRYLTAASRPRDEARNPSWRTIPALAASRSFVDERLQAKVERLRVPAGTDVPGMLGAGACGYNDLPQETGCHVNGKNERPEAGPPGHRTARAYPFVRSLRGVPVGQRSLAARQLYARAVRSSRSRAFTLNDVVVDAYWRHAPARYRRLGPRTLEPLTVRNGTASYVETFTTSSGFLDQPTDNLDVQFRRISNTAGKDGTVDNANAEWRVPRLGVVGRFDPLRLRGFSALSRVPLETYYPPALEPGDTRTRALLHGRTLLPSQNLGDYEQQPPLLLTNLRSLPPLLSSERFSGLTALQQRAPISVIRVRVEGVTGPNDLSEARIRTVAQLIHDRTGLAVDVTAGSSPTPLTIKLPAGKFGRPPLTLEEGWVQKGASVSYLRALDRKDLALFALVLVVCCFFLANGTLAAVRARRTEIGTLRTLGWPGRAIVAAVLGELLLVGIAAGLAGAGLAAALVRLLDLHFPLARVLYVLPLAVVLALLAGLGPALEATRGEPLDAVRPSIAPGGRGRAGNLVELAVLNLRRLPLRTILGAAGLALGVAALTILVGIEQAFRGTLVGTLLGNAVSIQVHRADLVAAGITIGLAGLAVADVLYLNLRERAPELAALRATGWTEVHVARLVLLEALGLGLVGSACGLGAGLVVGAVALGVPLLPLLAAGAVAAAAGTAAAVIAASIPTLQTLRDEPARVLAAE
jgi:hypothetical protein